MIILNHIPLLVKIKDVFDFYSEINCNVNLISLEELLFNELKSAPLETNSINKLRLNEFREMTFDTLIGDKKFNPEKMFILKYIRKIVRSSNERSQKSFYIYNKNFANKNNKHHDIIDDEDFIMALNESESANLIISPEQCSEYPVEVEIEVEGNNLSNERSKSTVKKGESSKSKSKPKSRSKEITYSDEKIEIREDSSEDGKDIDYITRGGRSFLERSKIIHEFQMNNGSIIENKSIISNEEDLLVNSKFIEKKRASMDESILLNSPKRRMHSDKLNSSESRRLDKDHHFNLSNTDNTDHVEIGIEPTHLFENLESEGKDHFNAHCDYSKENPNVHREAKRTFYHRPNVQSQKFSSIFSKMRDTSKYSNLCSEFKTFLKTHRFIDIMNNYSTLKFSKNTLERVCIPQFRDVHIQSEAIDVETKNYSMLKDEEDGPISVNNKRILLFILMLITVFVGAILFIFLSN
jgi:hypothetical protein